MLLRSNFSSFSHYYIYIFLTSGVKLHIHLLNVVVQFIVLLTLSTLICRSTDISKCFSESLGVRDNEVRLYNNTWTDQTTKWIQTFTVCMCPENPLSQSTVQMFPLIPTITTTDGTVNLVVVNKLQYSCNQNRDKRTTDT